MKWIKRLFHPLIAFIAIQLVWGVLVLFWISWFLDSKREFRNLAKHYRPELVNKGLDWTALLGGLILLLVVLAGIYVLFLYWKRQYDLYRQQKNIISQVTHELKSPLASIQLHLETIRLRPLAPEKTEQFLDLMLDDVDRLNHLISNLLMAAKLEQRTRASLKRPIDFSAFLAAYFERKRMSLPEGSSLSLDIEENITVTCNPEEMETALRNLFENATLYSPTSPEISITLRREGKRCHLTFQDRGKGIDPEHLKKIFRMFYRVRSHGENIRGTGLGLYIVKSVITAHGGKIKVTSEGLGTGTTFHISLPLAEKS
ncbi:MAG: HAMP domain-containing histidine kinase [Deltaproteobacteria bacterium]|nr:HAMP domain-containing histidine kinase [Deltaproteobacteria bacterium]TLN03082.1 MAG: HAMP domain-containing histidine kinase [bacterium]